MPREINQMYGGIIPDVLVRDILTMTYGNKGFAFVTGQH
jgi:hypothetical protein